jgi:hypothetical protein
MQRMPGCACHYFWVPASFGWKWLADYTILDSRIRADMDSPNFVFKLLIIDCLVLLSGYLFEEILEIADTVQIR